MQGKRANFHPMDESAAADAGSRGFGSWIGAHLKR
jgi:hypothetical protein